MRGGEIFIPKIKSINIVDLAKAIIPNAKFNIIGVQAGEKLHEDLFSKVESENIIEFKNYYVLKPVINLNNINYNISLIKEKGKKINQRYELSSKNNEHFLSITEIKKFL